jgi:hypothetical protein
MEANDDKKKEESFATKLEDYVLKHKKPIYLFSIIVTLLCALLLGLFTAISVTFVEILVNVNIALFGFLLAFTVYIYNSYESRINKWELELKCYEQKAKYAIGKKNKDKFEALQDIYTPRVTGLRERRKEISHLIVFAAFVLLLSLALLLSFLGAMYADTSTTRVVYFEPVSLMGQVLLYTILSCLIFGLITVFILVVNISRKYDIENNQTKATGVQSS